MNGVIYGTPTALSGDVGIAAAERIRLLAAHSQVSGVAYQSVAVAGARILYRVLECERQAALATISLAQREKLRHMVDALEEACTSLCSLLSAPCTKLLGLMPSERQHGSGETNWWFALTEAIESLDAGIDAIKALVSAQPRGGVSRTLGSILVRLFYRHRVELLREAEHWIG